MTYTSPLELLAEKFYLSPRLLRKLNPNAKFIAEEQLIVPNVDAFIPKLPDKNENDPAQALLKPDVTVVVYKKTADLRVIDADGKLLFYAPVTVGSFHDPLPLGNWKIMAISRNPVFFYNPKLFWDANPRAKKRKIKPGPNNPVGVVWLSLSARHYGIHGTPEPGRIGHSESHGCVRLTNWDAQHVADLVKVGTPVIFQREMAPSAANVQADKSNQPSTPPAPAKITPEKAKAMPDQGTTDTEGDVAILRSKNLLIPVQGVSSDALQDTFNDSRVGHAHEALDILAPRDTPVLATEDGTVARLWTSEAGGLTIYQYDPAKQYTYYYAHLERYAEGLQAGDILKRGQVIGYVGTSGNAPKDTPHLHFAIFKLNEKKRWWEGTPINPYPVLH